MYFHIYLYLLIIIWCIFSSYIIHYLILQQYLKLIINNLILRQILNLISIFIINYTFNNLINQFLKFIDFIQIKVIKHCLYMKYVYKVIILQFIFINFIKYSMIIHLIAYIYLILHLLEICKSFIFILKINMYHYL